MTSPVTAQASKTVQEGDFKVDIYGANVQDCITDNSMSGDECYGDRYLRSPRTNYYPWSRVEIAFWACSELVEVGTYPAESAMAAFAKVSLV